MAVLSADHLSAPTNVFHFVSIDEVMFVAKMAVNQPFTKFDFH